MAITESDLRMCATFKEKMHTLRLGECLVHVKSNLYVLFQSDIGWAYPFFVRYQGENTWTDRYNRPVTKRVANILATAPIHD